MKYIAAAVMLATALCAGQALAQDNPARTSVLKKPIELRSGASDRMHVIFRHTSHKGIKCGFCHHASPTDKPYVSCTTEECHSLKGPRERDSMSVFMAFHSRESERSCYSCHSAQKAKHPEFTGCRPCHKGASAALGSGK
ncbi:MAG TPA: cytochrome c3 family protein [Candidatus Desulfovibrio intestinigallinarum]|nr:cytochrome c3 family protein [Candidatus Desulfovibrio intestinigallinarum]